MAGSSANSPAARRARNASTEVTPASRNSRSRRPSAATQLGDGAAHEIDLLPVGDRADVRQPGERPQRAAAEVEHVHADLRRGVGEREAEDHRREPARLARPRPADHREVAGRAGEVDDERVAPLQVGPVDQADGACSVPRPGRATEHLVQGRRRGQRRQPDAVRGRPRPASAAMIVSRTVGASSAGPGARRAARPAAPARPRTGTPAAARPRPRRWPRRPAPDT